MLLQSTAFPQDLHFPRPSDILVARYPFLTNGREEKVTHQVASFVPRVHGSDRQKNDN